MPDLFDIDTGGLGLEAVHSWGTFDLNDRTGPDVVGLRRITGLHDMPDLLDPTTTPHIGRPGEGHYLASLASKTVLYEGFLRSATLPALRALTVALRAAVATGPGYMDIVPDVAAGGPTGRFYGRPVSLVIEDVQEVAHWRRQFALAFRLSDPRIYFPALAVSETHASTVEVENVGSAPVDPLITVAGASGDVEITDGTRVLSFTNVPSGSLVINFATRTAKVATAHAELVVPSSDWWDAYVDGIAPGATVDIAQTGGTSVTVAFTPAAW